MFKLSESKIGDITPNGFEIVNIYQKPVYVMRKRITIKKDVYNKEFRGKKAWLYCDGPYSYVKLDGDDRQYRFRDIEIEY